MITRFISFIRATVATMPHLILFSLVLGVALIGGVLFASAKKPAVKGVTTQAQVEPVIKAASPTPTPTLSIPTVRVMPSTIPLIDCVGPDGKHTQATQVDCDNLNNFWKSQTSETNHTGGTDANNSGNSNTTTQPTPTPTATPSSTPQPSTGKCTPVSFSETKTVDGVNVTVSGAWYLNVKANPNWQNATFDTNQLLIFLSFNVPTGTIYIHEEGWDGSPLCQTYEFGK